MGATTGAEEMATEFVPVALHSIQPVEQSSNSLLLRPHGTKRASILVAQTIASALESLSTAVGSEQHRATIRLVVSCVAFTCLLPLLLLLDFTTQCAKLIECFRVIKGPRDSNSKTNNAEDQGSAALLSRTTSSDLLAEQNLLGPTLISGSRRSSVIELTRNSATEISHEQTVDELFRQIVFPSQNPSASSPQLSTAPAPVRAAHQGSSLPTQARNPWRPRRRFRSAFNSLWTTRPAARPRKHLPRLVLHSVRYWTWGAVVRLWTRDARERRRQLIASFHALGFASDLPSIHVSAPDATHPSGRGSPVTSFGRAFALLESLERRGATQPTRLLSADSFAIPASSPTRQLHAPAPLPPTPACCTALTPEMIARKLPPEIQLSILSHLASPLGCNEALIVLQLSRAHLSYFQPKLYRCIAISSGWKLNKLRLTLCLYRPDLARHIESVQVAQHRSDEYDRLGYLPIYPIAEPLLLSTSLEQIFLAAATAAAAPVASDSTSGAGRGKGLSSLHVDLFSLAALNSAGTASRLERGALPRRLCTELSLAQYLSLPTFSAVDELELAAFGMDSVAATQLRTTLPRCDKLTLRWVSRRAVDWARVRAMREGQHAMHRAQFHPLPHQQQQSDARAIAISSQSTGSKLSQAWKLIAGSSPSSTSNEVDGSSRFSRLRLDEYDSSEPRESSAPPVIYGFDVDAAREMMDEEEEHMNALERTQWCTDLGHFVHAVQTLRYWPLAPPPSSISSAIEGPAMDDSRFGPPPTQPVWTSDEQFERQHGKKLDRLVVKAWPSVIPHLLEMIPDARMLQGGPSVSPSSPTVSPAGVGSPTSSVSPGPLPARTQFNSGPTPLYIEVDECWALGTRRGVAQEWFDQHMAQVWD